MKRKIKAAGVNELKSHPDQKILSQGSVHKSRVFLNQKADRDCFKEFITQASNLKTFCEEKSKESFKTSNGVILYNILCRLASKTDVLPDCYEALLNELSKNSPVCGLLQVTNSTPLKYLRQFALKEVNLRHFDSKDKLKVIQAQLPAFWPILMAVCDYEKSVFCPSDVNQVILQLLKIRRDTFEGPDRFQEDYHKYESDKSHECEFYPMHPLLTHPAKYSIDAVRDEDFCEKQFTVGKDFTSGIFSIGK